MSQEDVEIVRRSTDAVSRRDLDGWLETWAQDAMLDWSNARAFDAGIYRGHREIRAFAEGFLATWDEVRFEFVYGPVGIEDGVLDHRERRAPARTRRHRSSGSKRLADHDSERQADLAHALPDETGRPRSRRAAGVGRSF